jgi:GT2 family glycosyltransferase
MTLPLFSVIIPTYRRPDQLADCLEALGKQDYPADRFEVIVVNDGGESNLQNSQNQIFSLRILQQPRQGPAAARNCGAREAQGEYLAFTDDDCTPATDWLQKLAAIHASYPCAGVGGRTLNKLSQNSCSQTSQMIIETVYQYYNTDSNQAVFFASNNVSFPARLFQKIGGFDASFNRCSEDRELCDRWIGQGLRLIYQEEAVVYHAHSLGMRDLCRQHFGYGRGAFRFHQRRRLLGKGGFRIEFPFYRALLMRPFQEPRFRLSLLALLFLAEAANLAGYAYDWLSSLV